MFPGIGYTELVLLGIIAILLFGGRLPEVARSLGSTYRQLRRGLNEMQSTLRAEFDEPPRHIPYRPPVDDHQEPSAPRLEPPRITQSDSEHVSAP
jgi:sec-independent protein translocase protein TatA